MAKSKVKPRKPFKDFPLFAHNNGQWAKKIKGKQVRFGTWDDPDGALERFREYVNNGLQKPVTSSPTVGDAVNGYLNDLQEKVDGGDRSQVHFQHVESVAKIVAKTLAKHTPLDALTPDHFRDLKRELGLSYPWIEGERKKVSAKTLTNRMRMASSFFNFAKDEYEITVRTGKAFTPPDQKTVRNEKRGKSERRFEADEIHALIELAAPQMKAMILLAINSGMGAKDVGDLWTSEVDLVKKWLHSVRSKTGIERSVPLWPETCDAIQAIVARPRTDGLPNLFTTKYGKAWYKGDKNDSSAVTSAFNKLLDKLGIKKEGVSFYALRHTFQKVADETLDFPAVRQMMTHVPPSDKSTPEYRGVIEKARLVAVSEHMRQWLFGGQTYSTQPGRKPRRSDKARGLRVVG